jgi:hypothetical protein
MVDIRFAENWVEQKAKKESWFQATFGIPKISLLHLVLKSDLFIKFSSRRS